VSRLTPGTASRYKTASSADDYTVDPATPDERSYLFPDLDNLAPPSPTSSSPSSTPHGSSTPDLLDLDPPPAPPPIMANLPTSVAGASQSNLWSTMFLEIGPISALTWPRWESKLPGAVAAFSRVAGAHFYVNGRKKRPDYNAANLDSHLEDDAKARALNDWIRVADSLKAIVTAWGGSHACAAVDLFDTQYSDVPGLWKLLKSLGDSGTGAKKVVVLKSLTSRKWHKDGDPHAYFAAFEAELAQLNSAYKAAADSDPTDVGIDAQADRLAALSMNVARDIALLNLLSDYGDHLTPHMTSRTTYFEKKEQVLQLYATRQSREALADIDARRAVAQRVDARPSPPQQAEARQQDAYRASAPPPCRGGSSRTGSERSGAARIDVKQFAGFDKWRGSTFTDSNGVERFKIPPGTCFAC